MAHCAAAVRPEMRDVLRRLADVIGHNREVAGLHFASDTRAGRELAGRTRQGTSGETWGATSSVATVAARHRLAEAAEAHGAEARRR